MVEVLGLIDLFVKLGGYIGDVVSGRLTADEALRKHAADVEISTAASDAADEKVKPLPPGS